MQFAFGGSTAAGSADAVLPRLGLTGIQFINVVNACATGGSSLLAGFWAIKSHEFDLGIVLGFDKHPRGAFNFLPSDYGLPEWYGEIGLMLTTQYFGMKIRRYMHEHGISKESLARVAHKAFRNGSRAQHSWRKHQIDLSTILESTMVADPLTKYMFCSPSEGAAAVILASDARMRQLGLRGPRIRGAAIRTRPQGSFEIFSPSLDLGGGPSVTQLAADAAFESAGVAPRDIDLAQIQDTESGAEIMHMAENGFCDHGQQEEWLRKGWSELGGRLPINTDGGCIACGEPIGASGLRQICENVLQLKGQAGDRQVAAARLAYSHVYGLPGISAATILER
jgi:acetyl-CoA acetyltransferase